MFFFLTNTFIWFNLRTIRIDLQNFLSKYIKLIKRLGSQIKESRDTKDQLKTQLETLDQSFRTLHKEKEELAQNLLCTQNKLQEILNENQKELASKVTKIAEKQNVN